MSCSRSPSIQSRPAHVTLVDWHCAFQESRQSGVIRMSIPSTHCNTRGISHNNARIRRPILTSRVTNSGSDYCDVGDGDGEVACITGDCVGAVARYAGGVVWEVTSAAAE